MLKAFQTMASEDVRAAKQVEEKKHQCRFSLSAFVEAFPCVIGLLAPESPLGLAAMLSIHEDDDFDEDEVVSPIFDEEIQKVVVSIATPPNAARTLAEVARAFHFAVLARNNAAALQAEALSNTAVVAQRIVAEIAAHQLSAFAANPLGSADLVTTPPQQLEAMCRNHLDTPWGDASPEALAECMRRTLPVSLSSLELPSLFLLRHRVCTRASRSFGLTEKELLYVVEPLRWKLIGSIVNLQFACEVTAQQEAITSKMRPESGNDVEQGSRLLHLARLHFNDFNMEIDLLQNASKRLDESPTDVVLCLILWALVVECAQRID